MKILDIEYMWNLIYPPRKTNKVCVILQGISKEEIEELKKKSKVLILKEIKK